MALKSVSHFEKVFETFAPSAAAPFEYSGIIANTKPKNGEIKKICLALDLTTVSVQEAIKQKADLLILFHAPDELRSDISWQKNIKDLADNKLILYKAHLRLNFCLNGVNDVLCKILNLPAKPLTFLYEDKNTISGGVYEARDIYSLNEILEKCKVLRSPEIRVFNAKPEQNKYKRILVSSGSGFKMEFLEQFAPDMIISGEAKHGIIYVAKEYNTTLVEMNHWASEDRPLNEISKTLSKILDTEVTFISLPFDMATHTL